MARDILFIPARRRAVCLLIDFPRRTIRRWRRLIAPAQLRIICIRQE
jgi:hypothetical protein